MILAGPPKSGKSLIAAEIALTLALPFQGKRKVLFGSEASKGKEPIAFEVEPPAGASGYKVVFFSFEMRPPEVAHRLRAQLGGLGLNPAKAKKDELSLPLVHVFGLNSQDGSERSDLQIIKSTRAYSGSVDFITDSEDFKALRTVVEQQRPDLIVFDTLVQMHREDENDNVAMNALLKAIRRVATRTVTNEGGHEQTEQIAHVILHHTRKGQGRGGGRSADDMRGAGAVHGAADIAFIISAADKQNRIEVTVSSRSSSLPEFYLERNSNTLVHTRTEKVKGPKTSRPKKKLELFRSTLFSLLGKGNSAVNAAKLRQRLSGHEEFGDDWSDSWMERKINGMVKDGDLKREGDTKNFAWGDKISIAKASAPKKRKKNPKP